MLRIVGVEIKRGDAREELRGDVVVDAAGRNSPVCGWLEALGGKLDIKQPAVELPVLLRGTIGCARARPSRRITTSPRDLDYLKYAIFYAEHGHFAVAFGCAEDETDLVAVLRRPDSFDACARRSRRSRRG